MLTQVFREEKTYLTERFHPIEVELGTDLGQSFANWSNQARQIYNPDDSTS